MRDKENMYVDDLISGGTTAPKARDMKNAATEIFADAAFELHKWHSNVAELDPLKPIRLQTRRLPNSNWEPRQGERAHCLA